MPLHASHVGQRVVVRRLLPGQTGPSGGPAMTDVLGVLESLDEHALRVRPEHGDVVTIERSLVVTGKPVPPRSSTRLRISAEQLERICEQGWRALTEERLGDWTLRSAGGFTGRANSARVGGDPGLPAAAAIEAVVRFYTAQGLTPMAQVISGSDWLTTFEAAGWIQARPDGQDALVQVASVAQARRRRLSRADGGGQPPVALSDTPTDDWMSLYGRAAGVDQAVARTVLQSGDAVAFASIGDPVVAIGRGVVTGDWMGLQAVEVAPGRRRQGLATRVVDRLLEWGASQGALSAYLQTLPANVGGLQLYARYGFITHHAYRYLRPPERLPPVHRTSSSTA